MPPATHGGVHLANATLHCGNLVFSYRATIESDAVIVTLSHVFKHGLEQLKLLAHSDYNTYSHDFYL